jgi:peptide subunit release factor 1 (eRF1)
MVLSCVLAKPSGMFSARGFEEFPGILLVQPPKKIKQFHYSCSDHFKLDTILDMYLEEKIHGVALVSSKLALVYKVSVTGADNQPTLLKRRDMNLATKHGHGGQSQHRMEHLREEQYRSHLEWVVSDLIHHYVNQSGQSIVESLVLAGPTLFKKNLKEHPLFQKYFSGTQVRIVTTDSINEGTVTTVLDQIDLIPQQDYLTEVRELLHRDPDRLVFGYDEIREALEAGQLEKLYTTMREWAASRDTLPEIPKACKLLIDNSDRLAQLVPMVGLRFY